MSILFDNVNVIFRFPWKILSKTIFILLFISFTKLNILPNHDPICKSTQDPAYFILNVQHSESET